MASVLKAKALCIAEMIFFVAVIFADYSTLQWLQPSSTIKWWQIALMLLLILATISQFLDVIRAIDTLLDADKQKRRKE